MQGVRKGLLLAALVLLPTCGAAQWSPSQPLSHSASAARIRYNFGWAIDVDAAGVVHAAWLEEASADPPGYGTGRVMYSRSADDGRTWSPPIALSGMPLPAAGHPRVAAAGPHVYVAWHGLHDGSGLLKAYLLHSPTHGSSWDAPQIISDNTPTTGGAAFPTVNACGDSVHVVWTDSRSGVAEIYLRSSPDAGQSWTTVREVSSPDGRSSWVPTVACWGPAVHVAWSDERHNVDDVGQPYDCGIANDATRCREEEYYRRSTDFGNTWEPEVRLTVDPAHAPRSSWAPSIAVWENNVHVVFFDRRNDRFQVYYKRSTDAGASHTWEHERVISFDDGHPCVAVSPRKSAHVIWYEADAHGVDQIVHRARRALRGPWN